MTGYATKAAYDGRSALDAVSTFAPDLALLDIGLPVMDGYELAERLKAMPSLASIYLVAVTGYGLELDRRRSEAAGFDEHLVKPIHVDKVTAIIERLHVLPDSVPRPPRR